jgi:hypothetical protein
MVVRVVAKMRSPRARGAFEPFLRERVRAGLAHARQKGESASRSGVVIASSGVRPRRIRNWPRAQHLFADRLAHPPAGGRGDGQRAGARTGRRHQAKRNASHAPGLRAAPVQVAAFTPRYPRCYKLAALGRGIDHFSDFRDLRRRVFGEYQRFCAAVPHWIPLVRPYVPSLL